MAKKNCKAYICCSCGDCRIVEKPKTIEELDVEICDYCPLPDEAKGVHNYGNGPVMCEGKYCPEAYENYLEDFEGVGE